MELKRNTKAIKLTSNFNHLKSSMEERVPYIDRSYLYKSPIKDRLEFINRFKGEEENSECDIISKNNRNSLCITDFERGNRYEEKKYYTEHPGVTYASGICVRKYNEND